MDLSLKDYLYIDFLKQQTKDYKRVYIESLNDNCNFPNKYREELFKKYQMYKTAYEDELMKIKEKENDTDIETQILKNSFQK